MNIFDAFYATVHEYPGGVESLAPRLGMSAQILRNKANPNVDSNKSTLAEADAVMGLTSDYRILQALAHKHGFLMVKAPSSSSTECDMSVLEQVAGLMVANGVFGKEVYDALADGAVTKDELRKIDEAGKGVMTAVAEVGQRLHGMAE
jgi:hypothetical protein